MSLDLKIATTSEELATCLRLRRAVFIDEQGVDEAIEMDGEEDQCTHVLAWLDGEPVGAARYRYVANYAKLQRVCVVQSGRGQGIGAALIGFMVDQVIGENRTKTVRLGAQMHALDFYRKLGFHEFGEVYLDADIPHMDMERQLP